MMLDGLGQLLQFGFRGHSCLLASLQPRLNLFELISQPLDCCFFLSEVGFKFIMLPLDCA